MREMRRDVWDYGSKDDVRGVQRGFMRKLRGKSGFSLIFLDFLIIELLFP